MRPGWLNNMKWLQLSPVGTGSRDVRIPIAKHNRHFNWKSEIITSFRKLISGKKQEKNSAICNMVRV